MNFQEYLAWLGIDSANLGDEQRNALSAAWRKEHGEGQSVAAGEITETSGPFGELVAKRKADLARQQSITDACSAMMDAHPSQVATISEVGQTAISQGWNRERTELELFRRCERSNVSLPSRSGSGVIDNKLMEVALLQASGLPGVESLYDERTLQRANDQFGQRGLSLGEMLSVAARSRGWRGHSFGGDMENALRFAFGSDDGNGPRSSAVSSSYSVPTILNNVANKSLKVYFDAYDQSWREIAAIGSARNFQQTTDVALTGSLLLQDLPKGGEIKHGTLGEATYTNQVKTKALMLGIPREDLVNDDIGAFDSVMRRLVRGAALKFNNDFWPTLLGASAAFFDSSLGNAGTSTLNVAGLDTANTLFKNLTDPDGQFTGISPEILLVGTSLETTALQLMSSTRINRTGSTDAAFGEDNAFAGRFKVVANQYVSSTTYGGAANRWYLLASPNVMPVIEVKFLNGNQSPTVEQTNMNWNLLGISMRCVFDYGIALQERRGGVKEN